LLVIQSGRDYLSILGMNSLQCYAMLLKHKIVIMQYLNLA